MKLRDLWRKTRQTLSDEGVESVQVMGTGAIFRAPREPYTQEECRGVEVGRRCFDWYGPTLHALEDRPGTPALPALLTILKEKGFSPIYVPSYRLVKFSKQRKYQVFETDRATWRKPVLSDDGLLLVVHDPAFNGLS